MLCRSSLLVFLTTSALLLTKPVYAQRLAVAPILQAGLQTPYASFPSLTDVPVCCSDFGVGVGLGAHLGLELSTDVHPSASLSVRAMVGGSREVVWTNDQIGWTLRRTPVGNKVYPSYSTYVLDIASFGLDISALANIHLSATSPWRLSIGVGVQSPLSMKYDQYENLDDDAAQILSDSRLPQRDISRGDITSRANTHGRLIAGLRFDDEMHTSSRVFYDVTANLGFDPVLESGGGRLTAFSVRATVGVFFDLNGASDSAAPEPPQEIVIRQEAPVVNPEPVQPPPVIESVPTMVPEPTPEPEPAPIPVPVPEKQPELKPEPAPVEEAPTVKDPVVVQFATVYQLLPYVFFNPGSSRLTQSTYLEDCSGGTQQQVEQLVDTAMHSASYSAKHYAINDNLLNVVGYRMKNTFPNARLVIKGYVNGRASDSVQGIARDRARAIATYLERCWSIDQKRLRVEVVDRMSPNACTYALRDQVDVADAEEENTRCELSSTDEPQLLEPVVAIARIPAENIIGKTFESVLYVNTLSSSQGSISEVLKMASLPSVATLLSIVVTGYTDRKGPETINQRISEQRARKAASLLGTSAGKLRIDWIGEGARGMRAPYTNDTALGRMLNRCAEVRRTWTVSQQP